jgi:hypothetical protein
MGRGSGVLQGRVGSDAGGKLRRFFGKTAHTTHAGIYLEVYREPLPRLFRGLCGGLNAFPVAKQGAKAMDGGHGKFLRQGDGEEQDGRLNPRFP